MRIRNPGKEAPTFCGKGPGGHRAGELRSVASGQQGRQAPDQKTTL